MGIASFCNIARLFRVISYDTCAFLAAVWAVSALICASRTLIKASFNTYFAVRPRLGCTTGRLTYFGKVQQSRFALRMLLLLCFLE